MAHVSLVHGLLHSFSAGVVWDSVQTRDLHAFFLWLVIKRKLKTQDVLKQWDVSSTANLNLFRCPLCELHPDSREHLFFECRFSSQVCNMVRSLAGMEFLAPALDDIHIWLIPRAKSRSVNGVLPKLVFAASVYFIWQERNFRLFQKKKWSKEPVCEVISSTTRLKLLSICYKKSKNVEVLFEK
ncbi:reverse transcriptase zinc-binding domain-containing protein [Tanacetum coccineum]